MGNNLYSNLVNFYNVNDENFKEFMAEIYKEMLTTHRDVQYVKEHLTEEIEKILDKYLVDGKFNINIKEKVNEFLENNQEIKNITSQLDNKANKDEIFSMANMGQDVKEAMTGGSVAVVGRNAILKENIVNGQVVPEKTNFLSEIVVSNNLLDISKAIDGFYIDIGDGTLKENLGYCYVKTKIKENSNYSITSGEYLIAYFNDDIYVSGAVVNSGKFKTPLNINTMCISLPISMKEKIQINQGDTLLSKDNYLTKYAFNNNIKGIPSIIVVSKENDGDYDTITKAVENAKDGDVIIVKQGVYRGEVIKAWSKTITINGYDKANTIIVNNTGDYNTPPLEMCSGSLRNLTIIADRNPNGFDGTPAYAIHIENDNMENKTLEIDNCHIISHVNFAIGCGLRKGCLLDIKNSRLESYSELQGGLYVHDTDVDAMVGLQKLRVKNTEILSNSSNSSAQQLVLQSMHKTGAEFNVEFINVNVRNMVTGNQNYGFQDASNWQTYDRPELVPNITISKASYGNSLNKLNYV